MSENNKKYKVQLYRTAWEDEKEFRGWLRGIDNDTSLAFCRFCRCELRARKSCLLKHLSSSKHKNAAKNVPKNMFSDASQSNCKRSSSSKGHIQKDELVVIACKSLEKNLSKEKFVCFGLDVAVRLNKLNEKSPVQRAIVQKLISEIFFNADLDRLSTESQIGISALNDFYPITVIKG